MWLHLNEHKSKRLLLYGHGDQSVDMDPMGVCVHMLKAMDWKRKDHF